MLKHNIAIIQIIKYGKTQKRGAGFFVKPSAVLQKGARLGENFPPPCPMLLFSWPKKAKKIKA